jgi:16S rRNA (uracil1498-N3)-methyltransferase
MTDYSPATRVVLTNQLMPSIGNKYTLSDSATCKHLAQVKRLKTGQQICLVHTPSETAYTATIQQLSSKQATVFVSDKLSDVISPLPNITLTVALIKGQRWDWLLQKATELGVRDIQPLITQHTVVEWKNADHKLARWQEITKNAVEQCDGRFLPTIHNPMDFDDWLAKHPQTDVRLVLMERGPNRQPMRATLPSDAPKSITLVIGPEGGLSGHEAEQLIEAGFTNVLLGQRILRAETAAIAAISGIVALYS